MYDDLFFILVNVIMLSIISGKIIDAFGASRDRKMLIELDQHKKCFICGSVLANCVRCMPLSLS